MLKSLIINVIHFSGMQSFSGSFCGEERARFGVFGGVDDVVYWRYEK
jgi:hypothetical protein